MWPTPRRDHDSDGKGRSPHERSHDGDEFITHEFDEAIAIQQAIVDGAEKLSTAHSRAQSKKLIKTALRDDTRFLKELRRLGKKHDATGKVEPTRARA